MNEITRLTILRISSMKKNLGETIKLLRNAKDFTAVELADQIGVNKSYVSLLENNARRPSIDVLSKLATCLDVPLSFLVEVSLSLIHI